MPVRFPTRLDRIQGGSVPRRFHTGLEVLPGRPSGESEQLVLCRSRSRGWTDLRLQQAWSPVICQSARCCRRLMFFAQATMDPHRRQVSDPSLAQLADVGISEVGSGQELARVIHERHAGP